MTYFIIGLYGGGGGLSLKHTVSESVSLDEFFFPLKLSNCVRKSFSMTKYQNCYINKENIIQKNRVTLYVIAIWVND